ncbi:chromosome condensation protein CrcB [Bacillus sp. MKU004]|nr:chromosome condensation protein CrcB [Bacillus sp. MKU004]
MSFFTFLLVGVGGFLGAVARYSANQYFNENHTFRLPSATLFVNVLGSFLLGLLIGKGTSEMWSLLLGTGFLGSFTTFSTFKLEGIQLHVDKRRKDFIMYNVICYGGGILLAFVGYEIGRLFA